MSIPQTGRLFITEGNMVIETHNGKGESILVNHVPIGKIMSSQLGTTFQKTDDTYKMELGNVRIWIERL